MATETKIIYGIKEFKQDGEDKNFWTRIGTAFVNNDGSMNLNFDYLPTDPSMTIQVRDPKEKDS